MCASAATSSRRSPGVRRRRPWPRPTSSGCSAARRRRRKSASPSRSMPYMMGTPGGRNQGQPVPCKGRNIAPTMGAMKIALITGGNRGIGRSAAEHLARDGVGVGVTYNAHADEAEAVADAIGGVALQLDVTDIGDFPDRLREALRAKWDRDTFDFLVNNGGFSRGGLVADVTEQDVDDLFAVHFKGPLFLTQALLPLLADGGSIVNLSSGLARFTTPQRAAYGSVKAAVEQLSRYMAVELGPRDINVNVIAPGAVATDFSGGMLRDNPDFQEHLASLTPLGRHAVADDIGPAIANLLRDGNHWITGQRIEVSGGLHL